MKKLILFLALIISASLLQAQTGHWEKLNPVNSPKARRCYGMSSIGQDKVIIFGGDNSIGEMLNDTWIYDLNSNNWTEIYSTNHPPKRHYPAMTFLNETKVLLFGGIDEENETYFNDTWVFDLDSLNWFEMKLTDCPEKRYQASATNFEKNKVILYGGINSWWNGRQDTWIYDLDSNKWTKTSVFGYIYNTPEICKVNDNAIIEFGGTEQQNKYENKTYLYNSSIKNFWNELIIKNPPRARYGHSMAQLDEDKILLFGGSYNGLMNDTWIFNYNDTSWKEIESINKPSIRNNFRMAKLSKNKILLFSGYNELPMIDDTWLFTADINNVDEHNRSDENISISPNPATDFIEISFGALQTIPLQIKIYDVFGQEVNKPLTTSMLGEGENNPLNPPLLRGNLKIDISSLTPGLYFVRVGDKPFKFLKI